MITSNVDDAREAHARNVAAIFGIIHGPDRITGCEFDEPISVGDTQRMARRATPLRFHHAQARSIPIDMYAEVA